MFAGEYRRDEGKENQCPKGMEPCVRFITGSREPSFKAPGEVIFSAAARLCGADEGKAARFDSAWRLGIRNQFDGYRALALRGGRETRIRSRNQKDLGKKFPEITSSIAALDVQDAIIDGEIVALDDKGRSSFQLLQGFDMGLARPPIIFYAFDLLRLNGKDLQNLPIGERKAKLTQPMGPGVNRRRNAPLSLGETDNGVSG